MQIEAPSSYAVTSELPLPPVVPGLPFLGNALKLRGDMTQFLVQMYHRFGAAFRIRVLRRQYFILGGLEANQFLSNQGSEYLTSARFFGGFASEMGDGLFLPAMEGDAHRHLRKVLRPGYSKEAMSPHIEQLVSIAQEHITGWKAQKRVPVVAVIQHLITDQLGIILGGKALGEYFPYVRDFLRIVVNVTMIGTAPRMMLKSKRYITARDKTREFLLDLLQEHRDTPHGGDLFDIALAARDQAGQPYSEADLVLVGIGAYVAGMDTLANTLSFMLYGLLKNPDALHAVRQETDALFEQGELLTLQHMRSLKALHGAAMETMRLYMISPITMRSAIKPFTFAGYSIPLGSDIMIANGITHFLPEYFPDPNRFDIERDIRAVPPQVYTPFSLGAHTCLGAGVAESLLMLTAAAILRFADIRLDPQGYTSKISSTPAPNPGKGFIMSVSSR